MKTKYIADLEKNKSNYTIKLNTKRAKMGVIKLKK